MVQVVHTYIHTLPTYFHNSIFFSDWKTWTYLWHSSINIKRKGVIRYILCYISSSYNSKCLASISWIHVPSFFFPSLSSSYSYSRINIEIFKRAKMSLNLISNACAIFPGTDCIMNIRLIEVRDYNIHVLCKPLFRTLLMSVWHAPPHSPSDSSAIVMPK